MDSGLESNISEQATLLAQRLMERGMMLAVAESCTGGWVAKVCTDIPGSSSWFERGFVTYTNEAKQEMLGVSANTLNDSGAVSEVTVSEMAIGALNNSRAQVALAISGIAGPGGGSEEKPVGTVCFGWAIKGKEVATEQHCFNGDREAVRAKAVLYALQGMHRRVK